MTHLSISEDWLENLQFNANELATIRAIGECRGKQELYAKQSPEVIHFHKIYMPNIYRHFYLNITFYRLTHATNPV